MKTSIVNLIKEATSKGLDRDLASFADASGLSIGEGEGKITRKEVLGLMNEAKEYVHALLTREDYDGNRYEVPSLPVNEVMVSSDASGVFRRVISEVLIKPREPQNFLMNNVAKKITLAADAPLTVTFPVVGAYQAFEIAENGEYKSQALSMQEHITSLRLKKIGVMASLSEEIVQASLYPLIALNLELMANGINRKCESMLFTTLTQKATAVFDNDDPATYGTDYRTTGKDSSQAFNGSLALKDILKLAAVIVGNRYEPSHMLIHPLAYYVIFQDPIIRSTFFHQGQLGGSIWNQGPAFDQNKNMPFGIQYAPYYALPYNETGVMVNAPGSGFSSALLTDVYMIDARNSLVMLERGDIAMDEKEDWFRDATTLKARKYVNFSGMDAGKGMTVARNVRVVENFTPLFTVRTTT
jgi:hypothetical protein